MGDIDRIACETPADLNAILEQFYRKPKANAGAVFTEDVVELDQDDALPENSDGYHRKPPKNNNFIGRPMTTNRDKS